MRQQTSLKQYIMERIVKDSGRRPWYARIRLRRPRDRRRELAREVERQIG
jgi:hypothetical protein